MNILCLSRAVGVVFALSDVCFCRKTHVSCFYLTSSDTESEYEKV